MSDNPSVQRAARLLQDVLEDVCLDQLDAELDAEHPTDSDEFIADLTTGQLSPDALAEFRQHLRGCLLCNDVIDNLREHYPLTELRVDDDLDETPAVPVGTRLDQSLPDESLPDESVPAWAPAAAAETNPDTQTRDIRLSDAAPPATLEQAQLLLTTMRQTELPRRPANAGLRRTIAVLAAIAAVLVLVPALQVLLQPRPLQSTFATVATLSQFGLTSDIRGRDLTPDETAIQKARTLRSTLEQQPEDPVARLNLAAQLLANRQLDEARALIEAVLETRPQDPQVLNALALVQIASQEPQTALLTLQKAVTANPLFAPAALNLADLLVEQQQSEQAQTVLRQALQRPLDTADRERLQTRLNSLSIPR